MKWFKHSLEYPSRRAPLIERGWTQETAEPWRKGSAVVLRAPFSRRAVSIGRWTSEGSEADFHAAVGTRAIEITSEEIRSW